VAPLVASRRELPIEFVVDRAAGAIQARPVPRARRIAGARLRMAAPAGRLLRPRHGDDASAPRRLPAARGRRRLPRRRAALAAGMALGDVALRPSRPAVAVDAYVGIDRRARTSTAPWRCWPSGGRAEALDEARGVLARDPADADARNVERLARERLPAGVP
jgi:hypothetical protein